LEPRAAGEVFNITNGDQLRWRLLRPAFARHFGLDYAEPQPVPLADAMPQLRHVWERLVTRHSLVPTPYEELVGWEFGDFLFRSEFDNVSSTIKARQAGFSDCLDTEARFIELFSQLVAQGIIPPAQITLIAVAPAGANPSTKEELSIQPPAEENDAR
jgi:Fe2+ transport system protein FeoA